MSTTKPCTWTRKVDCRAGRRAALRDAIADLPQGVTLDVVIRHQDDCDTLVLDLPLQFCTCQFLTLEAKSLSVHKGG